MAGARSVTIANGQTISGAVSLGKNALVGIITPAALTGTAFTFQASADGSTYSPVYDKTGTLYSVTVSTSRYILLPAADFAGILYLKIASGTAEGGARTIGLVVRPV